MKDTLIQVNNYGMGGSESKLALILAEKYFSLLAEEQTPPSFIVFYNEGVKLLCNNSLILKLLLKLEARGTKLLACGTCLDFFKVTTKQKVGISASMRDIIALQQKAAKIINI